VFLLVPAHPGSPGQRAVKRLCVCVLFTETASDSDLNLSTTLNHAGKSVIGCSHDAIVAAIVGATGRKSVYHWHSEV